MGLLELGEITLTASERRLDVASRNVANASTPGYKRQVAFADAIDAARIANAQAPQAATYTDFAAATPHSTGRPFDLAIAGTGLFALRGDDDSVFYSRFGQFQRADDGRIVTSQGLALQTVEGDDLIVRGPSAQITPDGAVLEDGLPVAHIALFEPTPDARLQAIGGTLFSADESTMQAVANPVLRQGALEASNVELGAEMVSMLTMMRQAEAGARVVQAYDSLVGQSISTFGRSSR